MQISNKSEIMEALDTNVTTFNQYILSLNKEQFENVSDGKWSAGQNLHHLVSSMQPLQAAFVLPKFMLGLLIGKANRPSKTYEALVEKYKLKLSGGGKAPARFTPPMVSFDKKETLIKKYDLQKEKLIQKIKKQSEEELDQYILPHPLLGKITMREMLFFTTYHNEHHLQIVKKRKEINIE